MSTRFLACAFLIVPLSGCFGACNPADPEPEHVCLDDGPPPSTDAAIELLDEDGRPLASGVNLEVDYGSQGGHHIYLYVDAYGVGLVEAFVEVTFVGSDGFNASTQLFLDESCASWQRFDGEILQVPSTGVTGPLRVRLGRCDGSCQYDETTGGFSNLLVLAEDTVDIEISA